MKTTIRANVPGSKLPDLVPPPYRDLVVKRVKPQWTCTLLLFAHAERDVVHSLPVRRALRRMPQTSASHIVAVGTTFTEEALQLLSRHKATVVRLRESTWTDASAADRQR